jgi:hypothetical protein
MVRYRVKPDRVAENEELVRAVYEELARRQPEGLHYATFRLEDGVTFVHVAVEEGDGLSVIPSLDAFRRFRDGIEARCDEPPLASSMSEVGSYSAFGT